MNRFFKNKTAWEQRSRMYGATLKSVLLKNMPTVLNEHIHRQHVRWILDFLRLQPAERLLDVGCGYGRLTMTIAEKFPKIEITGFDISDHYVKLYRERTGKKAVQGIVEKFPQELPCFDCILCVTVLMYVSSDKLQRAFNEMIAHLTPKGRIILIESSHSGRPFLTAFGLSTLVSRFRSEKTVPETGGHAFHNAEIETLVKTAQARIVDQRRMPITTFLILPMFICAKFLPARLCQFIFKPIAFFDECLKKITSPTIHAAYLIEKA